MKIGKYPPKCTALFIAIKGRISPDVQNLIPLCPTRWTVHTGAIKGILDNYESLIQVWKRQMLLTVMSIQ